MTSQPNQEEHKVKNGTREPHARRTTACKAAVVGACSRGRARGEKGEKKEFQKCHILRVDPAVCGQTEGGRGLPRLACRFCG